MNNDKYNGITSVTISQVDELKFVDADIKEEFEDKNYFVGIPSMIQLTREIRTLIYELRLKRDMPNDQR